MITTDEQTQLKEIIGAHYADDVLDILTNQGIRKRNGHPHGAEYVRDVFQGIRSNKDIEAAIWKLAAAKKAEAAATDKLKDKIL